MEKITFDDWDLADGLETKEDIIAHVEAALAEDDQEFLLEIIGALARAKGMTQLAREMGVTREGLYKSIASGGNPSFATLVKLLDLLGFRLALQEKKAS